MIELGSLSSLLVTMLSLLALVIKFFALGDVVTRDKGLVELRSRFKKEHWIIILAAGLALHFFFFNPLSLFNLIGTVAALTYLAQVRATR